MALPTAEELLEILAARVVGVKKSQSGDKMVENYELGSLVEAAKLVSGLIASDTAGRLPARGVRFTKLIPPGGGGD